MMLERRTLNTDKPHVSTLCGQKYHYNATRREDWVTSWVQDVGCPACATEVLARQARARATLEQISTNERNHRAQCTEDQ